MPLGDDEQDVEGDAKQKFVIVVTGGNGWVARSLVKSIFVDPSYATALIGCAWDALGNDSNGILHEAVEIHVVSRDLDAAWAAELRETGELCIPCGSSTVALRCVLHSGVDYTNEIQWRSVVEL